MKCELCNQKPATVRITDIAPKGKEGRSVAEQLICEDCAKSLELPGHPVGMVVAANITPILELIHNSAKKARSSSGITCPDCGMSLAEFRSKGRFGCPRDYEVFRGHVESLLLRVHNSKRHIGRGPGMDEGARRRIQSLSDLRSQLEEAIREEAYESAARLRDQIQELEAQPRSP